jgi:hypothetical protein
MCHGGVRTDQGTGEMVGPEEMLEESGWWLAYEAPEPEALGTPTDASYVFRLMSTRIGPAYSVLILTVLWLTTPLYTTPGTSRVTPLTQLHTHFPLLFTPSFMYK